MSPCIRSKNCWVKVSGGYKPGDPPPICYADWHEWALVQAKAGLTQSKCPACGRWRFPQETCCEKEEA